ncbi:MAG TPA: hypothetical protein VG227_10135 [Caulobacteraceae bacterium]|jgi:hypothetical protein|nr:hypothetical protein [Caulobacteraceae bacterium]
MTCIPLEMEIGHPDLLSRVREDLADRRRRLARTLKQAGVVAMVFALGAGFHLMKWTGLIVL